MNTKTVPFSTGTRTCLGCGETLPRYHRGDYCKACGVVDPTDGLDAELKQAEHDFAPLPPRSGTIEIDAGCKLVSTPLPVRQSTRSGRWESIITRFLASGLECAKVEVNGIKNASSIYGSLSPIAKGRGCYPCVRQGACYLVRVKR